MNKLVNTVTPLDHAFIESDSFRESRDYWRDRCLAAEAVINRMGHDIDFEDSKEYAKWIELKAQEEKS